MPGLVNAHMHTWETALRGIGAEWMSADYLQATCTPISRRAISPEDNYLGNLIGALAQIDAGVTTLVDWCHNITGIELAERAVDGLIDSGIRAVFAHGTAKPTDRRERDGRSPTSRIRASASKRCARAAWRATTAASRSPWPSSVRTGAAWEVVEHDIRMAREFGLVSSSHTRRREDCVVPDGYRAWPRRGCSGRTTISCMAPATTRRISS